MLHISLLKSVQVFFGAVRWTRASLSSSFLFLSSFEKRIKSDFFLFLVLGAPPISLCPSLFLTIVWGAVPPLPLSVFLALFHQPVLHRPIFHPAFPPLCVLSAPHFFLLSIFPAFLFPTSLVAVPSSFSFPSRQAVLCYDAQTLLGQPVRPWWADWLDCLLSSIFVLTDHLRLPESQGGKQHRTQRTGRASRSGPILLIQTVDGVVTSSGSHLISCGHNPVSHFWTV